MSTAQKRYRQRTVNFPDHGKVKIVVRPKTSVGNLVGFYVNFNDNRYFVDLGSVIRESARNGYESYWQVAEDLAFVRWVKDVA